MNSSGQEIFTNGIFRFRIGASKKSFSLHKALLVPLSEPLAALITGGMRESLDETAQLEDVDESTFERFAEWVYIRSYTVAAPRVTATKDSEERSQKQRTSGSRLEESFVEQMSGDGSPNKARTPKSPDRAADAEKLAQMTTIGGFYTRREQDLDQNPKSSYLEHFLSHAKLFVSADQRRVTELSNLTATKLDKSMQRFRYYKERVEDVVYLADYIYENTASLEQEKDRLRQIVAKNIACRLEDLISSTVFNNLLERGGDFVKDLVGESAARMVGPKDQRSKPKDPKMAARFASWSN